MATYQLYDPKKFPLTKKWEALVNKISRENNFDFKEGIQEALIVEWETNKRVEKNATPERVENYFKLSLHRKLYELHRGTYEKRKVSSVVVQDDGTECNLIDTLVQIRPFEEIYFKEAVTAIKESLMLADALAAEMFHLRMTTNIRWNILKTTEFKNVSHNKFYDRVKLIKSTVREWVETFRGVPVGLGCLS